MFTQIRRRLLAAVVTGSIVFTCGIATASPHARAAASGGRDLAKSASAESPVFAPLLAGQLYGASLVQPTPNVKMPASGWLGTQWVSHERGKVRYETAAFIWRDFSGREVDILSGPAMTLSPAGTLARPRSRIPGWNFAPYRRPTAIKHGTIAGHPALYFDATAPPPGGWTLVGSNPGELQIDHDHAFRMAALAVHGKTVVIVIQAPASAFAGFLPVADRLVAATSFSRS